MEAYHTEHFVRVHADPAAQEKKLKHGTHEITPISVFGCSIFFLGNDTKICFKPLFEGLFFPQQMQPVSNKSTTAGSIMHNTKMSSQC